MTLSCFKQLPSNFTHDLVPIEFNAQSRLLLDAARGLILSSDNPFDYQTEISINHTEITTLPRK